MIQSQGRQVGHEGCHSVYHSQWCATNLQAATFSVLQLTGVSLSKNSIYKMGKPITFSPVLLQTNDLSLGRR